MKESKRLLPRVFTFAISWVMVSSGIYNSGIEHKGVADCFGIGLSATIFLSCAIYWVGFCLGSGMRDGAGETKLTVDVNQPPIVVQSSHPYRHPFS